MAFDAGTVIAILLPILYAVGGVIEGYRKGEKINWPILLKTIILAVVSAGLISQATADMFVELSSTMAVTYVLDKLINAIANKDKHTTPTAPTITSP